MIITTTIRLCLLVFLDIRKAFDRVNIHKLILKLRDKGIPLYIVNILIYWYCNHKFYVKWINVLSECFYPTSGLRQGSVLPGYYLVGTAGVPKILQTPPATSMMMSEQNINISRIIRRLEIVRFHKPMRLN